MCFHVKSLTNYFYVKTKISPDFQVCVSVPLISTEICKYAHARFATISICSLLQCLIEKKNMKFVVIYGKDEVLRYDTGKHQKQSPIGVL